MFTGTAGAYGGGAVLIVLLPALIVNLVQGELMVALADTPDVRADYAEATQRYGYTKEKAESEINNWLRDHDKQTTTPTPTKA